MRTNSFGLVGLLAVTVGCQLFAADIDLTVRRQEVFEFAEEPRATRDGDKVTITFTSKAFCDATVAIEEANPPAGAAPKILRHLASGVLGKNAPQPFQKDSLRQSIVWDGKDEIGRLVDAKERLTVRVSLGLKAQMERTLFWSGHKLVSGYRQTSVLMAAAPEGVYVLFKGLGDQVRLFDHNGNYIRTVYPFPSDKLDKVKGLAWREYPPDNTRFPSKLATHDQDTLLPARNIEAIIARGDRLWLVGSKVVCVGTDGSSGGTALEGPAVDYPYPNNPKVPPFQPHSAALSPDGKSLYLACYNSLSGQGNGGVAREWYHGVNVASLEGGGKMAAFAGVMSGKDAKGADGAHFKGPCSVACDAKGRVYVADHWNDRIQVFEADGKFFKTIPISRPARLVIEPKTGDLYVFCWNVVATWDKDLPCAGCYVGAEAPWVKPRLVHLGRVDAPEVKESWDLADVKGSDYSLLSTGWDAVAEIDFQTDPMTVWLVVAHNIAELPQLRSNIRMYQPENHRLVLKRRFAEDAGTALAQARPARFGRERLYVNPATGLLYRTQFTWDMPVDTKSSYEAVRIDPSTGHSRAETLPTNQEDMGFDYEGRAYLRTYDAIVRFDPATWREIPYDYGTERPVFHDDGGPKQFKSTSAVVLPGGMGGMFHLGGFGVNAQGNVAVSCVNPNDPTQADRLREKNVHSARIGKPYLPRIHVGRNRGFETHLFDTHGKLIKDDVAPGIGQSNMVQIDRDNNIYLLASSTPYLDGTPFLNGRGCTLIKFKPGQMKVLSAGSDATAGGTPLPLDEGARPKRRPDMTRPVSWVEGADWLFGPVGADGQYGSGGKCSCYVNGRFALDYFGRSFAPEVDRFRVVVLDSGGNVMMRIGKYGNVEDGVPLIKPDPALVDKQGGQPLSPRSIGGDEVAIMHCMNLAVHSDRRLFLADIGNQCIRSVKLGYHATETVSLAAK
ncbi:MAG: hypothetical protein PHU85_11205 [Phycisphaerae bacterium]|nr:hypothetical protein [Phycisphaerae bacterium]